MRWERAIESGGIERVKRLGQRGRPRRLSDAQLLELAQLLKKGSISAGYATEMWTLPRIAELIERLTGVRYHPGHVWYLLRRLNWSLQRPARRARERNEAAIRRWVARRWPAVKKTPGASEPGSSSRTKAAFPRSPSSVAPGRPAARRPS